MTEKVNLIDLESLKKAFIEASELYEYLNDEDSLIKLKAAESAYLDYIKTHD
jgi:hypothetical protein